MDQKTDEHKKDRYSTSKVCLVMAGVVLVSGYSCVTGDTMKPHVYDRDPGGTLVWNLITSFGHDVIGPKACAWITGLLAVSLLWKALRSAWQARNSTSAAPPEA